MNATAVSTIWLPDEAGDPAPRPLPDSHTLSLVELILKDRIGLHRLLRTQALHVALLPRFLAIALAGFVLFGVAMSLVLTVSERWPVLPGIAETLAGQDALLRFDALQGRVAALSPWINGNVLQLVAAYAVGLIAVSCVCLPSLYFYCLLAGVRMTMVDVVVHAVKAKAVSAVALVGILPIYVAVAMGAGIFNIRADYVDVVMGLGLILPSIAGFWGVSSLYEGFATIADVQADRCPERRKCFLRRLVTSWSLCYTAVMPVMIYTLWHAISR